MPVYDFSSGLNLLNQGINSLGESLGNRADAQAYAQIGDRMANRDYQGASALAWQSGHPDLALKLQMYTMGQGGTIPSERDPTGGGGGGAAATAAPDATVPTSTTTKTDGDTAAKPTKTTVSAGDPGNRWAPEGLTANDVQDYIRSSAAARGIDPDVAVKVAHSEWGQSYTGDQGRSFGPFQLFTGGGLGNIAYKAGINVRDPSTWKQQIDFALDHAASVKSWGAWYGARNSGIPDRAGLENAAPIGVGRAQTAGGPSAAGGANVISAATPGEPAGPNLPGAQPTAVAGAPAGAAQPPVPAPVNVAQAGPTQTPGGPQPTAVAPPAAGAQTPRPVPQLAPTPAPPSPGVLASLLAPAAQAAEGAPGAGPNAASPLAQAQPPGFSPALARGGPQGGAPGSAPAPASPMIDPQALQNGIQMIMSGRVSLADLKSQWLRYGMPNPNVPTNTPFWQQIEAVAPRGAAAAAGGPRPATDLTEVGGQPGAVTPRSQADVRSALPAMPDFGGGGAGVSPPPPPPPVAGGPPGYSAARTGAGAATEADPRAVAGVAKDVPAQHTPATVPARLQPKSSPSAPVQGPAGPAGPRPSQAEQRRFLGPAASNAAADFGVAPSAIRAAPQVPAPMPGRGDYGPYAGPGGLPPQAAPGGPGGPVGGPGAPAPAGGANPIQAILARLGIGPQPGAGAQPAQLGPGGAPGGAPAGGGGPGLLGGLLNMASMQPPGGVPGLQTPASSLGYGAPRPLPGGPGFPQLGRAPAAVPAAAPGAPGPVVAGGPAAPAAPNQAAANVTPEQAQGIANRAANAPGDDLDHLKAVRDQTRELASQVAFWSPERAKIIEDGANKLDERINEMEKQRGEAGLKTQEITQQTQKEQAGVLQKNFADQHAKLTGASGVQASLENINAMEGNLQDAARGMGKAQELGETIAGLLAPFDPKFAGLAAGSQEFNARATQEMIQMANQLFAQGRLNRTEFNAIRDGTFTLGDRPDVVYDMLELARHRALLLADNHNDQLQRFKKNYGPYGGTQTADQFGVDVPKELRNPGDRAAITGTGASADKPLRVHTPDDLKGLKPGTWVMRPDGQVKQIGGPAQ